MRKNLIFSMFATATLLLATSCQQDEVFVDGNEATVTFEVGTPQIATRAFSQGEKATKLQYAVYDAEFNYVDREGLHGTIDFNKQANVPLQLAAGKTYKVLFWADAYGNAQDAPYIVDFAALKMNVNYTGAVCNDEGRDAFYNLVTVEVGQANETKEVTLTRPFAQLNIGTDDLNKLDGVSAAKTQVKVNVYNQLDLKTGFVTTGSTATTQTFTLADRPAETEAFPVDGYKYLAMNYLLVGKDKTVVDVEFSYGADAATAKTRTYTGIPVQPNYRTNIYGALLTQGIDFDVEIEPGYNGNIPGDDMLDKLILASQVGGEITLESDIVTDNVITVAENVELTINLNGKTITGNFSDKDNETIIDNDGTLKIIGGTIKNTAANGASIINNSGSLILDGVTILGAPIADGGYPSYAIYTSGSLVIEEGTVVTSDRGAIHTQSGADVTINGGNISVTDALGSRTLTAHVIYAYGNGTKLTINDGTFALNYAAAGNTGASVICPAGATIDVYNGNFSYTGTVGQSAVFQNYMGYGAPVNVYGGTYSDKSVLKHVADGYVAIENANGTYTVEKGAAVNNATEFATALTNGGKVILNNDITLTESVLVPADKEVTLDFGTKTMTIDANVAEAIVNNGTLNLVGGTIANESAKAIQNNGVMTINGTTINATTTSGIVSNANSVLTIENANITSHESVVRALGSTVIIKDGEYKQTGTAVESNPATYRYCIDGRWDNDVKATITIEGGKFESNNGLVNVGSDIIINGGEFTCEIEKSMTRHMFYTYAPLTINGGTFYGVANSAAGGCFICMASSSAEVTIKGGKFTSLWSTGSVNRIVEYYAAGGSHNVTGGLFNTNLGIESFVEENTDDATKTQYPYVAK
ncbi:MAG: hypothetical protein J6J06_01165 [Bacteroidaceae bacterium]|nr:hypothetical protein [Bacteroidaceae bacterium]